MKIKIVPELCTGCKQCQYACSLAHTGKANPWRSRIRVYLQEEICLPMIAGTDRATVSGMALRPATPVYKDPNTGMVLVCDFCGDPPDPQCVRWCAPRALTLIPE